MLSKMDLVKLLAEENEYTRYLELCTSSTGGSFKALDPRRFVACDRLMYFCPEAFDDGLPVHYRSHDRDIAACLEAIGGKRYDIALVDPWHEYQTSYRDIATMFALLAPGGSMVVHDCLPEDEALTSPVFHEGSWCGVTYKAFLDFTVGRTDLLYCTVNTDYGCGVIKKLEKPQAWVRRSVQRFRDDDGLAAGWRAVADNSAAFAFMQAHKETLLGLVEPDQLFTRGVPGIFRTP